MLKTGRPVSLDSIVLTRRVIEYGFEALPQCIMYLIALQYTLKNTITNENTNYVGNITNSSNYVVTNSSNNVTSINNDSIVSNAFISAQLISLGMFKIFIFHFII